MALHERRVPAGAHVSEIWVRPRAFEGYRPTDGITPLPEEDSGQSTVVNTSNVKNKPPLTNEQKRLRQSITS